MAKKKLTQSFNQLQEIINQVANKVDKEEGKHLSSNDYTDEEKSKVKGSQRCFNNETPATPKEGDIRVIPETETEIEYTMDQLQCTYSIPQDKVIRVTAPEDATSLQETYVQGYLTFYMLSFAALPIEFAAGELTRIISTIGTTPGARLPIVKAVTPERKEEYINGQWVSRGSIATVENEQGYYHNTTPSSPKEGDICEYDEVLVDSGLEAKSTDYALSNTGQNVFRIYIPSNMQGSLQMAYMYGITFGKVKIYCGIYNQLNGGEQPIAVVESEYQRLKLTTNDGDELSGLTLEIPAYYSSPWSGTYGCIKVEEELEDGQSSLLPYLKIDLVTPRYTQEYKDGAWFIRSDFPVVFDSVPMRGSKNLINSGAVFQALGDKQHVYTVEPSDVTSPKEGDICVVTASEKVVKPQGYEYSPDTYDLTAFGAYKIKVYGRSGLYSTGQIAVTHANGSVENLTIGTDLAEPVTYDAGEITAIDGGGSTLAYGINVYRLVEAGIYEYLGGSWVARKGVPDNVLMFVAQALSAAQKLQARLNIDAASPSETQGYYHEAPVSPKEGDIWDVPGMTDALPHIWAGNVLYYGPANVNYPVRLVLESGVSTVNITVQKKDGTSEVLTDASEFPKDYAAGIVNYVSGAGLSGAYYNMPAVRKEYINGQWETRGSAAPDVVKYTQQTLTDPQKTQARTNIGAAAPEVFWATFGVTTRAEVVAAVNAGKIVAVKYSDKIYFGTSINTASGATGNFYFSIVNNGEISTLYLGSNETWGGPIGGALERSVNKKASWSETPTDTNYPTEKLVKDSLDNKQDKITTVNLSVGANSGTPTGNASFSGGVLSIALDNVRGPEGQSAIRTRIDYAANENTQVGLAWDTVHVWPAVSGLDVTLAAAPADDKEHLLSIVFETPADITNFTLSLDPQHILWGSDINLSNVLKENTRYEISIPSTSMIALFTAATLPSNNS